MNSEGPSEWRIPTGEHRVVMRRANRADRATWGAIGAVIAALVGLAALGITMPWETATKTELTALDKENAKEHESIRTNVVRINDKLETIDKRQTEILHEIKSQRRPR